MTPTTPIMMTNSFWLWLVIIAFVFSPFWRSLHILYSTDIYSVLKTPNTSSAQVLSWAQGIKVYNSFYLPDIHCLLASCFYFLQLPSPMGLRLLLYHRDPSKIVRDLRMCSWSFFAHIYGGMLYLSLISVQCATSLLLFNHHTPVH